MSHVVTVPTPPFRTRTGSLEVHQLPAWNDNLIWLLVCPESGEAAAVDGPEAGVVLEYCDANGFRFTSILNTHVHGDHIGINRDMAERGLLAGLRVIGARRTAAAVPGLNAAVDDGDRFRLGGAEVQVLLTEGHINGHVSYVVDDVVLCGDTLFGAGCGYLFDGPAEKMYRSLTTLAALDSRTRVCCAHEYTQDNLRFAWSVEPDNEHLAARIRESWAVRGQGRSTVPSTIALERDTNPFLRSSSPTIRAAVGRAFPERKLDTDVEVFAATRALKDRKDYRSIGDDQLPL